MKKLNLQETKAVSGGIDGAALAGAIQQAMMASAACILLVGIGLGVGSTYLYEWMNDDQ